MATRPDDQQAGGEAAPRAGPPPTAWEWLAAAIGLLLLLASVGYLLADHWGGDAAPPVPVVQVTGIEPQAGRWLVRVRVSNASRGTAAALRVEGELKQGGQAVERSEVEFDFVPGRSSREGGLFFSRDPRGLELDLQPKSYQRP
jgi:uncharacterized protein (TIGR02588 family)